MKYRVNCELTIGDMFSLIGVKPEIRLKVLEKVKPWVIQCKKWWWPSWRNYCDKTNTKFEYASKKEAEEKLKELTTKTK